MGVLTKYMPANRISSQLEEEENPLSKYMPKVITPKVTAPSEPLIDKISGFFGAGKPNILEKESLIESAKKSFESQLDVLKSIPRALVAGGKFKTTPEDQEAMRKVSAFPLTTLARVPSAIQALALPIKGKGRIESAAQAFLRPEALPAGYSGGEIAKKINPKLWPAAGALGSALDIISFQIGTGNVTKRLIQGYKQAKLKGASQELDKIVNQMAEPTVKALEAQKFFPQEWNMADKLGRTKVWIRHTFDTNPIVGEVMIGKKQPWFDTTRQSGKFSVTIPGRTRPFLKPLMGEFGAKELPGKIPPEDIAKSLVPPVAGGVPKIPTPIPTPEPIVEPEPITQGKQGIETDQARVQEIKNSIAEGEMILKSGTISGRKMSPEELNLVQRSVDNAKAKIGQGIVAPTEGKVEALSTEKPPSPTITSPEIVQPVASQGPEIPTTLAEKKVKSLIREVTGQYTPEQPTIKESYALARSLKRQEQVARKASISTKRETKEIYKTLEGIKRQPIQGMGYEERAKIDTLKQEIKTTRTLAGLKDLYHRIQFQKEIGKAKYLQTKETKDNQFALDKEILLKTQGTPPSKKPPYTRATYEEISPGKSKAISQLARATTLRPSRIFDMLDNGQNFEGPHNQFFYNRANRADNAQLKNVDVRKDKLLEFIKSQGMTLKDLAKYRDIAGIKLTSDEIISVYVSWENSEKTMALIYGNNIPIEKIQIIIEEMTPQEKAIGDAIIREYEENRERLRKAFIEFTDGKYDLGKVKGYTPIRRLSAGYEPTDEEIAKEMLERENLKRAYAERGFTKERKYISPEFQKPMRLGEVGLWLEQVDKQEHFITHGNLIREMQRMVSDKGFRDSVISNPKFGKEYYEVIEGWVNRVANPNIYKAYNSLEKVATMLRGNAAIVYLGFNIITMAKQFPSIALFLEDVGLPDMLSATAQLSTNYPDTLKFIHNLSPQLKHRSLERELEEFKKYNPVTYRRIINRIGEVGMIGIYEVDKYVVSCGWLANFNKHTRLGLSEQEAAELAEKSVLRTQPAAHAKDIAQLYATNEFLNLFTQFSNQLNQIYNIITYDIPASARQGRYRDAMRAGFGVILSAYMIYSMSKGRFPITKEEIKDMAISSALDYIPLVGRMMNSARQGFDAVSIPGLGAIESGTKALGYTMQGKFGKAVDPALETVALLGRFPYAQFRRTFKGMSDINTGKTKDPRRLLWSGGAIGEKKGKLGKSPNKKRGKLRF